jgi:tetratricopeptide (TPR) repeat protein
LHEKDQKSVAYRRSLAWSLHKLATAYVAKGDVAKAIDNFDQALALRTALADEVSAVGDFKDELAGTELEYARLLADTGKDPKRAQDLAASAVKRVRALVASDPINNDNKETLTQALLAVGDVARATGDGGARTAALEEAVHLADDIAKRTANVRWPGYQAEGLAGLADMATARGDAKTATANWKRVRELLEPLAASKHLSAARKALLDKAHGK